MSQDQSNMPTGQGYDQISSKQENQDMGGGVGAHGSGVAGGHEGQSTTEKQDWLDKGIQGVGKKFGMNLVSGSRCASRQRMFDRPLCM